MYFIKEMLQVSTAKFLVVVRLQRCDFYNKIYSYLKLQFNKLRFFFK
jgi:hypothetical protein